MKKAPMRKVSTNHSRNPHLQNWAVEPVRPICPRSAANTPNWQVTDDSNRTVVLTAANVRSSVTPGVGQSCGPNTDRTVKYIAKRAAKNISSLASQTMVPTLTMLGLPGVCTACRSAVAVATRAIMAGPVAVLTSTPRIVPNNPDIPPVAHGSAGRSRAGSPPSIGAAPVAFRQIRPRGGQRPEEAPDAERRKDDGPRLQRRPQHKGEGQAGCRPAASA